MGDVERYRVTVNGTETVLKLSAKDAKSYEDAVLVDGQSDATEAGDTSDAADDAEDNDTTSEKAAKPANKSRTAQNKTRASGPASNS